MHNIKDIRSNFENFKKKIESRNVKIDFNKIIELDKNYRKLLQEKENHEQKKRNLKI